MYNIKIATLYEWFKVFPPAGIDIIIKYIVQLRIEIELYAFRVY